MPLHAIPAVDQWLTDRQRARTDLLYLCNEVLQYKDIAADPHMDMIDNVQKFQGGKDFCDVKTGVWLGYKPAIDMWKMPGPRRRMFWFHRGSLKTTTITVAHSIQWLINYYDIRILISTAVSDQAQKMLSEISGQLKYNEWFRTLFPEVCPSANHAAEFGNQEEFTIPCREKKWLKEPTVSVTSVGKVIAGYHYEVIKHSDIVDKENIKTDGGRRAVAEHFKYMSPLIERNPVPPHYGWQDVEGTPYDFLDAYNTEIVEKEGKLPQQKRTWQITIKGCYRDAEQKIPFWKKRWPVEALEDERHNLGDVLFAAQMLCNPIPDSGGLAASKDIVFFPRKALSGIPLRYHCTVDLHGMEDNAGNDSTVLNVSGFDNDGRMYLIDLKVGHFDPFETIEHIFQIHKRYKDIDFKIEKDAHARVLLPFLKRERTKRNLFPRIIPIQRDTRTSKKQRIRGLQSWFKSGNIRILEDLEPAARLELIQQITRFTLTSHYHDDILDTMADQCQNGDGGVSYDLTPRTKPEYVPFETGVDMFLGFDEFDKQAKWLMDQPAKWDASHHKGTGL